MELYENSSALKGPPKATLAKRAKSYSNFYDAAVQYLSRDVEPLHPFDALEAAELNKFNSYTERAFEDYEDELLDASHQEYQYGFQIFFSVQN